LAQGSSLNLIELIKQNKPKIIHPITILIFFVLALGVALPILGIYSLNLFYNDNLSLLYWILTSLIIVFQLCYMIYLLKLPLYNSLKLVPRFIFILFVIIFHFIISLIFFPLYFLNDKNTNPIDNTEIIDVTEIETSIRNINNAIYEIEKSIQQESTEISTISEKILNQIKEKKKELENIQVEQKQLKEEIKYYKNLLNISKEDANILLTAIQDKIIKRKYFEYFLGFIIGVLSSLIATFIVLAINKKIKHSEQHEEIM